ncbi:unnamed protein product [Plutella xylostella]|uniref:(diamondback moth) hypothetical protein n=1 Tax=Plutella xylostella TaxID=51655 RepID=A0A8S4GB25_PLUXY|nr:unnamed protein product [Plutella xylostella]
MLQNSGPYGPNDVPGSLGAPMEKPQIGPVNMSHNLSHISKISQDSSQCTIPQYNLPHYPVYGHNQVHAEPQQNLFPNFTQNHVHRISYPILNHALHVNSSQNGVNPLDFNYQNPFKEYFNNVQGKYQQMASGLPSNSGASSYNPISTKASQKVYDLTEDSVNTCTYKANELNMCKEPYRGSNLDVSFKNSAVSCNSLVKRTERIENAVKHIESIIASDMLHRQKENQKKTIEIDKKHESFEPLKEECMDELEYNEGESDNSEDNEEEEDNKDEIKDVIVKDEPDFSVTLEVTSVINKIKPFVSDVNGCTKEQLDSNEIIITANNSVNEATYIVKNKLLSPHRYYECPNCNLLLNHPKRFLIHVKWHTFGLTNLKRQALAEAKEMKKARKRGEVVNPAEQTYPCSSCDKAFSRPSALKSHKHKYHKIEDRKCDICNIVVGDWRAYRLHHETVHKTERGFKCTRCDKIFKHKHTLTKHEASHEEKTVACPDCPKLFGSQRLLRQHAKTHERAQRGHTYHCSYCGKGFFESYTLQVHERTHRNEKPYSCTICGAAFNTNSSVKRHMKVSHSTEKPFECPTCHRSFSTELIRDRHCMRVHGDQSLFKFPCEQCDCKYLRLKDLKKHASKAHPKSRRRKNEVEDQEIE